MIVVEPAPAPSDDVRALIAELDGVLSLEYPPEQRHGLALDAIFAPHVRFFIAHLDGAPAGCGGVALFAGFAEVKRMYVRDVARGRGVARALLSRIEAEARAAERTILCLETGDRQTAAIRLYERAGYRRRGAFGDYLAMTAKAVEKSVFFEKRLHEPSGY